MKNKNLIITLLSIIILLALIISAAYAYFTSSGIIIDNIAIEANTEGDAYFFDAIGGSFNLNITSENMLESLGNNVAATAETNLVVNFLSGTENKAMQCSYDIAFEWTSTDRYIAHSALNTESLPEFTLQATLSGSNAKQGTNLISAEQDIATVIGSTNPKTLITGATINNSSASASTVATWHIVAKFYNLSTSQADLINKSYAGSFKIVNVNCGPYQTGADTIAALASETGAGAAGGHPGAMVNDEYGVRYIGENPSNFVWFNCSDLTNQNASTCERWRIIGVFDEKYDSDGDNIPDTTGPLIKIIRNDSLGSYSWDYKQSGVGSSTNDYGSNDWSDSQLMMMLNPPEFLNSGYVTEEGAATHSNTISGEYVVSNGINIYRNMGSYFDSSKTAYSPAETSTSGFTSTTQPGATFTRMNTLSQSMIATVKWHLTGTGSYTSASDGLASHWYAYERNDPDGTGYVYTGAGTRPKIWYGKVGLVYASDYGFATSGDSSVSGYDRASCLNKELYNWASGSYQTYCAYKDWLLYVGATGGTSATKGSASYQWTITPSSAGAYGVFFVYSNGHVSSSNTRISIAARPVLYLKTGVSITEGSGTYDSPYKLSQ